MNMDEHTGKHASRSAGPDEGLLREIRQATRDLWHGVRRRLWGRALACLVSAQAAVWCALWLLGGESPRMAGWGALAWTAWGLLCMIALGMGAVLAAMDALAMLVVRGPLLARLGQVLRPPDPGQPGATPREQFAAFASPQVLSRAARLLDLPLILFLVRSVLGVDAKQLLRLAQGGADREIVLRELEGMARLRAATTLRRGRLVAWGAMGLAAALTALALWLLTG